MNIALYFGSFNPIHNGHLIIANHIAHHHNIHKVWLVITPQNPHKPQSTLLNEYHRLHLANLAIENTTKIQTSTIEFNLPKPNYTIHTLAYLKEKHPNYTFSIIMGSDSLQNLPNWKNYEQIIANHTLYIYERPGYPINLQPTSPINNTNATIIPVQAPLLQISSTYIRTCIQTQKPIQFMLPTAVEQYIHSNGYYK
jgi:nicotinate-nucleotide adenylyltransferase